MGERDQKNRWRCVVVGCNPVMKSEKVRDEHVAATGHRTAKWPIRSAEGKRRARARNRSGYYDKYNAGEKSHAARFGSRSDMDGSNCQGEDGEDYWGDSTGGAL